MVQLFVFSEYFKEKEKRAPITGALQTYFRRFDVTKNVTELVKIGVNQCNMETENPNILRLSGAFNTRYWGFQMLEQMTGIEPAYSAWEADTLPLSYICGYYPLIIHQNFPSVKRIRATFLKLPGFFCLLGCFAYERGLLLPPRSSPLLTPA